MSTYSDEDMKSMLRSWKPVDSNLPDSEPRVEAGSSCAPVTGSEDWLAVSTELPAVGAVVWLWDGKKMWIGGRDFVDCDTWLWGNAYSSPWWDGGRWDGDIECDDDYQPTHWKGLPNPPNDPALRPPKGDVR